MKTKPVRPLTVTVLVRAAQAHLSRRAASRLQLERVLLRKAERAAGPDSDLTAQTLAGLVEAAVDQVARAGWLNDEALAETRAAALARNGLPARGIKRRLAEQGLALRGSDSPEMGLDDERQARRYAERKRLGPLLRDAARRRPIATSVP